MSIPAGLRKEETRWCAHRGPPGVPWAAEDRCGGGRRGVRWEGGNLLSFWFLFYIPYLAQPENCVRSTSVSESKSSFPPWRAGQNLRVLLNGSAPSGTRHGQQGGVSLFGEAKKGAW